MGEDQALFPIRKIVDPGFCFMIKRGSFIGNCPGKRIYVHTGGKFFQECLIQNKIACFHHAVKGDDRRGALIHSGDIGACHAFPASLYVTSASLLHHHMHIPPDYGRIKGNTQFFIGCRFFRLQFSRNNDHLALMIGIDLPVRDIRRIFNEHPSAVGITSQHHTTQSETADT